VHLASLLQPELLDITRQNDRLSLQLTVGWYTNSNVRLKRIGNMVERVEEHVSKSQIKFGTVGQEKKNEVNRSLTEQCTYLGMCGKFVPYS
jgi:hypothetical protein